MTAPKQDNGRLSQCFKRESEDLQSMKTLKKEISVKINPNEIPDADYDLGCSILASSVKRCFEQPGTKEEYEKWLEAEENSAMV